MFAARIFQRMKAHERAAGALHSRAGENLREARIMAEHFADTKIGVQERGRDRVHRERLGFHEEADFAREQIARRSIV